MLQYNLIKNRELHELVMRSESIQSLPEKEAQDLIEKIAALPEEGQREMLKALEEEQRAITKAKAKKGIKTPEDEAKEIEAKTAQIKQITHEFKATVRKEEEGSEQEKTAEAAEKLLSEL